MGTEDNNGDMRFQHRDGDDMLSCPSSVMNTNPLSDKVVGMAMSSDSMFKASNGAVPYFSSGWDPLVSLSQSENFGPHSGFSNAAYPVVLENQVISSTSSLLAHYQPDSGLGEMMPKLSCFGSGSFSEMVNSFGLPECGQMNYSHNKEGLTGKALITGTHSEEECQNSEDKSAPNGKKKRRASESHSPFNSNKNAEVPQQHDPSGDNLEQDEKKQKIEQNINANLRGKQTSKQTKENSDSGDAAEDNYIHVRAKRGQATNSHSLAERVRRERISERMRLLQELVPGCNKITGKAVMLDEIINYVQSLQQQVEFLSMKLATVNPELNVDMERILSKDVLNLRSSHAAVLGFPGLSPTHPFPQGSLPGIPTTTQPFHTIPQSIWDNNDNELHNLLQMGFDSNNNLGPTGNSKLELYSDYERNLKS